MLPSFNLQPGSLIDVEFECEAAGTGSLTGPMAGHLPRRDRRRHCSTGCRRFLGRAKANAEPCSGTIAAGGRSGSRRRIARSGDQVFANKRMTFGPVQERGLRRYRFATRPQGASTLEVTHALTGSRLAR